MTLLSVALATLKGFSRDKIFHGTVVFSVAFILFAYFLSTLTIVETRKILLDFGFTAISLSGIGIAIFTGLTCVGKEIETRTIYTVLAKPVSRTQYLFGKYLGAAAVVAICHGILSLVLTAIASGVGEGLPAGMAACLFLITLESLFVLAVAFVFSVVMSSSFLAATITLAVFLSGRASGTLVSVARKAESELSRVLLQSLWSVVPNLERFNARDLVAYGKPLPEGMVLVSTGYFLFWVLLLLTITSIAFERRDLP
ncbi:MAG: ABC transporter permease [Bdellovibrionales bacterium]|nr:ABC transporter permease [Bdellovibrionales bacterium]